MLDGGIIQRLLEEKWKTFARNQFLKRLLILFVHLLSLSISVYLRPATENLQNKEYEESRTDRSPSADGNSNGDNDESDDAEDESMDVTTVIRYASEVGTLIGVLSYVVFQQGHEIKNQGFSAFLKQLVNKFALRSLGLSVILQKLISFDMIGQCTGQSHFLGIEFFDSGLHSISIDRRYGHRGSNPGFCSTGQLVFAHVLRWVLIQ